jgi:hypothetical protein
LIEIPLLDRLFTWSNNQPSPILARLDRVLVNTMWNSVLPDSSLHSFTRATSDHVPLLSASSTTPKPAIFRFSNHWISHVSFGPLVTSNWLSVGSRQSSSSTRRLSLCLKRVRSTARAWAKHSRPLDITIKNCDLVIAVLDLLEEKRSLSSPEFLLRKLVRSSLSRLTIQRAAYRRQRSKVRQCLLGDENTSYHHQCATFRLQRNNIRVLMFNGMPRL